jgi:fructose-bisphosphate aldolase class II
VAAINVVNDLTMEAVLAAAVAERSPLIVQTSVKTVRSIGIDLLFAMWREMTAGIEVPVSLHLDHCPDRSFISDCLRKGWNSVLFDGSRLPVAENLRLTVDIVAEARSYGAHVEGEIEAITGVEDDIGSDEEANRESLPVALDFIRKTGIDVFAPAIGNAHGVYRSEPHLDAQRVSDIARRQGLRNPGVRARARARDDRGQGHAGRRVPRRRLRRPADGLRVRDKQAARIPQGRAAHHQQLHR